MTKMTKMMIKMIMKTEQYEVQSRRCSDSKAQKQHLVAKTIAAEETKEGGPKQRQDTNIRWNEQGKYIKGAHLVEGKHGVKLQKRKGAKEHY